MTERFDISLDRTPDSNFPDQLERFMTNDTEEGNSALEAAKQTQCAAISNAFSSLQSNTDSIGAQELRPELTEDGNCEIEPPPITSGLATPFKPYVREYPEHLEPWDCSVNIEDAANEIHQMIKRHCVLTPEAIDAITLWTIASYDIDAYRIFPKLALISPIKRCGKTTTIETVSSVCKEAFVVANTTAATLFRLTVENRPTMIIDEADTFVKGADPSLIGIINSGYNKASSFVVRSTGEDFTPRRFSTWMPMMLASIGDLASTIMDRSIVINLRRKRPDEMVDLLPTNLDELMVDLRRKIIRWSDDMKEAITKNVLRPPYIGSDRAADNWTPLFTIAQLISPTWVQRCEIAYRSLTRADETELPAQLLTDIREILDTHQADKIKSSDLISALNSDPEKPWAGTERKGSLTPKSLAQYLQPFAITSSTIRFDDGTFRGYSVADFKDAFERYVIHQEPIKPYI